MGNYMVSSFHLTRSARLCLAHRIDTDKTGFALSVSIRVHPWPRIGLFALKPSFRNIGEQGFRVVPVDLEYLPHQVADGLVPSFKEHEDRGAGAAQRAAEQAGGA